MFLTALMFIVAIALSAVAAFYSIVGLTAIFSAAVLPIIIMGTILEVAKVVTTIWLHEYWRQCRLAMKLYLVPAVVILMLVTSMGIFGFLSKAHLDQTVPTGDVAAQVALIDEKINNERDTIENARTLLAQLDRAVTDIGSSPDREVNGRVISSAERALQVRRQQARDRSNLTQTIEQAQSRIVKLQEEKAPFARDLRKIEAEVGPIKYIAALIYGDNPDQNLLERAVRWVIIILVAVFDPLAIMMLLAATESRTWHIDARRRKEKNDDDIVPAVVAPMADSAKDLDAPLPRTHSMVDRSSIEPEIIQPNESNPPEPKLPTSESEPPSEVLHDEDEDIDLEEHAVIRQCKRLWKQDNPGMTLKEQRRLVAAGILHHEPWLDLLEDPRIHREAQHGPVLPNIGIKGDMFIITSVIPTALFKYNGEKWISIDKTFTDQYAYNDSYIDYLIVQIGSGAYDPDLLTDAERSQIDQRLRREL
jgi:hypothetical protein